MKRYKEFINEDITKFMTPKSENSILKGLERLSDNEKIEKIIKYHLDFDLLPRDENGVCVYNGNLFCEFNKLTVLPDNLTVNGGLYCDNNELTVLPGNLVVSGTINCSKNKLTELPSNFTIGDDLDCRYNQLTSLPDGLEVKGRLICKNNKVKLTLPPTASVGSFIN